MAKLRNFLEHVVKILLAILSAEIIAIIGFLKSKVGIMWLEAILIGLLILYLLSHLVIGYVKWGCKKNGLRNNIRSWFEAVWIGAVIGLDIILIEQFLVTF